jgi:hypothetical protein
MKTIPYGRLDELRSDEFADLTAYRWASASGDCEIKVFPSRESLKAFLKQSISQSIADMFPPNSWNALIKDVVPRNMLVYRSFQKEEK